MCGHVRNCCNGNLVYLLKYFIDEKGANLKTIQDDELFIRAAQEGHKEIVAYLIEKEIDINQQDNKGFTALMHASNEGHKEIVKLLLEHRDIQVNQQDYKDKTALMHASEKGHQEIEQMLVLFQSQNNIAPEKLSDRIIRRQENDFFLNQSQTCQTNTKKTSKRK